MWNYLVNNPEVATAIGTFFSIITAMAALTLSFWGLSSQRKHNRLSLCPKANFVFGNFEDSIFVKLNNSGMGPLIVKDHYVLFEEKKYTCFYSAIIDLFPTTTFVNYSEPINGMVIAPGVDIPLIEYGVEESSDIDIMTRDKLRDCLYKTEFVIEYWDLYMKNQPCIRRNGRWFRGVIE